MELIDIKIDIKTCLFLFLFVLLLLFNHEIALFFLLSLLILFIISIIKKRKNWKKKWRYIYDSIPFFILIIPPFLVIGTIIGWSQFITTEEFWVLNFYDFSWQKILFFGVINLAAIVFLVWKETNASGEIRPHKLISRSLILFFKGVFISLLIGYIFIWIYGFNAIEKFSLHKEFNRNIVDIYEKESYKSIFPIKIEILNMRKNDNVSLDEFEKNYIKLDPIIYKYFITKIITLDKKSDLMEIECQKKDAHFINYPAKSKGYKIVEVFEFGSLYSVNSSRLVCGLFSNFSFVFINVLFSGAFMALFLGVVIQFVGESLK